MSFYQNYYVLLKTFAIKNSFFFTKCYFIANKAIFKKYIIDYKKLNKLIINKNRV